MSTKINRMQVLEFSGAICPIVKGRRIAVLGLAFKPETDDMRESPAIPIVSHLLSAGARVQAFDPVATGRGAQAFRRSGDHLLRYPLPGHCGCGCGHFIDALGSVP
jgi:UDP-glucose 6-dehydrogenase